MECMETIRHGGENENEKEQKGRTRRRHTLGKERSGLKGRCPRARGVARSLYPHGEGKPEGRSTRRKTRRENAKANEEESSTQGKTTGVVGQIRTVETSLRLFVDICWRRRQHPPAVGLLPVSDVQRAPTNAKECIRLHYLHVNNILSIYNQGRGGKF